MRTFCALIFFLFVSSTFAQTIRRVNADATVTGTNVYQTLQAAHNEAAAGDVLIVEPGNSVGSLTCNKTLTIYGNGSSAVGGISINANNVKISGCAISGDIGINGVTGVVISRNSFGQIDINGLASAPASNITISQNRFNYSTLNGAATGLISNIVFSNNEMNYIPTSNSFTSNITVNQNNFNYGFPDNSRPYNCSFTNNTFRSVIAIAFYNNNSLYFYNAFATGSTVDSGMGQFNIFVTTFSDPQLLTKSSTGGEIGIYGGATPFVNNFIPATPAVTKLRSDGVGNSTTPITLTISAKSNN